MKQEIYSESGDWARDLERNAGTQDPRKERSETGRDKERGREEGGEWVAERRRGGGKESRGEAKLSLEFLSDACSQARCVQNLGLGTADSEQV